MKHKKWILFGLATVGLIVLGSTDLSLGAVGSVASTGFEWLGSNDQLNTALFDAFFSNPPRPEGNARWIFGEILTAGKNILMARDHAHAPGMTLTYTYLGDPALRMDVAPPRLHVDVNGEEVDDGSLITSTEIGDSVHVDVGVLDEVAVASPGQCGRAEKKHGAGADHRWCPPSADRLCP